MSDIKYIDPKEFQEFGYLQELNRVFLHLLGMALEVIIDDKTGKVSLGGIRDYRDDPEGMRFAEGTIDLAKTARVRGQWFNGMKKKQEKEVEMDTLFPCSHAREKTLKLFVPKGVTIEDIFNIAEQYGFDNDTLSQEQDDENQIPYEIKIILRSL